MGIRVKGPEIVGFMEWLRLNAPSAHSFSSIPSNDLYRLAADFTEGLPISIHDTSEHPIGAEEIVRSTQFGPELWRWLASDVQWRTKGRGSGERAPRRDYDLLDKHLSVPFSSIFLYTDQDIEMRDYLTKQWDSLDRESGSLLNFYDYAIRVDEPTEYSYSEANLAWLYPIRGANVERIRAVGLPCMLVWQKDKSALVPFGDATTSVGTLRDRFRKVLQKLSEGGVESLSTEFEPFVDKALSLRPDVFLSYTHGDIKLLKYVDEQVRRQGYSTWYDEKLTLGRVFDSPLRHVLDVAKATVVIWTDRSIHSDWVRAEALYAHNRRRLAPVSRGLSVTLPPPFNVIHTAELERGQQALNLLQARLVELCGSRKERPFSWPWTKKST